jgi:hypothetical protein
MYLEYLIRTKQHRGRFPAALHHSPIQTIHFLFRVQMLRPSASVQLISYVVDNSYNLPNEFVVLILRRLWRQFRCTRTLEPLVGLAL